MQQCRTLPSRKGGVLLVRAVHMHVCPRQCLPAKAPGSGHRRGDCHEPPSPRALRCCPPRRLSALCLALLGTVPAFPGHSGQSRVRRGGMDPAGQGSASPLLPPFQPVLPRAPSSVPTIPMPGPGLARLPFALLTMPEPGIHRRPSPWHCWVQEGFRSPQPAPWRPRKGCCGHSWGAGFWLTGLGEEKGS